MKKNQLGKPIILLGMQMSWIAQAGNPMELVATHSFSTGKTEPGKLKLQGLETIKIPAALEVVEGSGRNAQALLHFQSENGKETVCHYAGPIGKYFVRLRYIIDKLLNAAAGVNTWSEAMVNPDRTMLRQTCKGPGAKSDRVESGALLLQILVNEHHVFSSNMIKVRANFQTIPKKGN